MGGDEHVLRWNEYSPCMTSLLSNLLRSQDFVDVTLTAEGENIKCHKLVLSACSPYFQKLFRDNPCQHPVVILRDVEYSSLKAVVEYMYMGEVKVSRDEVEGVRKAAEALQVRGLIDEEPRSTSLTNSENIQIKPESNKPQSCWFGVEDLSYTSSLPCKKRRLTAAGEGPSHFCPPGHCRDVGGTTSGSRDQSRISSTPGSSPKPDMSDIRPDILEMIKEEQKAKMVEISQGWISSAAASPAPGCSTTYQNHLQNMWQKCWSQNNSVFQGLRYRERGPMKSWRPETMAEAIWSVLNEGLSLSQAARKHDIPYPTFVLYANRVHNMLGPSVINGISDLRPKGRGRPQRILLGQWPEDHVRQVIRTVVFRDGSVTSQTPPPTYTASETSSPLHPLASESKAAQAAFEAQMKSFYSNPFASQLLAASSKMYQQLDEGRFLQSLVKQEMTDSSYEDADEEQSKSIADMQDKSCNSGSGQDEGGSTSKNEESRSESQDQKNGGEDAAVSSENGLMKAKDQLSSVEGTAVNWMYRLGAWSGSHNKDQQQPPLSSLAGKEEKPNLDRESLLERFKIEGNNKVGLDKLSEMAAQEKRSLVDALVPDLTLTEVKQNNNDWKNVTSSQNSM